MDEKTDTSIKDQVAALNLGQKIRSLRNKRGFTLNDVSIKSGMSKPLLSQIENNIAAPPIATLIKIATALGVKIGYFFEDSIPKERIVVVRKDERSNVKKPEHTDKYSGIGYHYESLAYPLVDKHMEPFIVEVESRKREDLIYNNHEGEEFIHLLKGKLEFQGYDKEIILNKGDSLYFDSSVPHAMRGIDGPAKALAVLFLKK